MLRRPFLLLLFVFLLVFAQQEAMLHPYEHTADWQKSSTGGKQTPPHSENCGKCLALADITGAVAAQPPVVHLQPGFPVRLPHVLLPVDSASTLFYRSRAPPSFA